MEAKLELIKYTKAIDYLSKSLPLLAKSDYETVKSIIGNYEKKIDFYNKQKSEVINPTKKELGVIRSGFKRNVSGVYVFPLVNKAKLEFKSKFPFSERYIDHKNKKTAKWCFCSACEQEDYDYELGEKDILKESEIIYNEVIAACSNTIIPEEFLNAKILLKRGMKPHGNPSEKENEITAYLKTKFIEVFNEQNKELVNRLIQMNQ